MVKSFSRENASVSKEVKENIGKNIVVCLVSPRLGLARVPSYKDISFEIQIKLINHQSLLI